MTFSVETISTEKVSLFDCTRDKLKQIEYKINELTANSGHISRTVVLDTLSKTLI